ncbi:unnamed protein product [Staurois parvus]|uniref:Uncharacterized protein n=1 Tax=Staurois parvus TaxID=386267 RepID=A0ABN9HDJ7_9NEOB|nr:unnamed protein product [Staurois parvus]
MALCSSSKLAYFPLTPTGFQLLQGHPYRGSVPGISPQCTHHPSCAPYISPCYPGPH